MICEYLLPICVIKNDDRITDVTLNKCDVFICLKTIGI